MTARVVTTTVTKVAGLPGIGIMTSFTACRRGKMTAGFTGCCNTIMTGIAAAAYSGMIKGRRQPRVSAMASAALSISRDMSDILARCSSTIVAASASSLDLVMID